MPQTLDDPAAPGLEHCELPPPGAMELRARHAREMRSGLERSLEGLASGLAPLHLPRAGDLKRGGEGHFHLAAELFLQLEGTTRFRFPGHQLRLAPGACLLVPPRLLHAEIAESGAHREPFRNLVIYADGLSLRVHLAHEARAGRPGILYLETSAGSQAARMHDWLSDAARLAGELESGVSGAGVTWAEHQARGLLVAVVSGVLRALEQRQRQQPEEPALVAEARVLVQNQLGDQDLSVRSLSQQLGRTPDYLSQLFRISTGESLGTHITRLRMERAEQLLRDSRMAGKEIAWACGYSTQSYFIRSFREHYGLTPKDWRQKCSAAARSL